MKVLYIPGWHRSQIGVKCDWVRIVLQLATASQITVKEEEYIYTFISFIANIGGTLGLFLGFSFITVWDMVKWIIVKYMIVPSK